MASTFASGMSQKIQNLLSTIAAVVGKDIDLSYSRSFSMKLDSPDGQALNMRVTPLDQGLSTFERGKSGDALNIVSSGEMNANITEGSGAVLVAGTVDVTVPGGVPVGSAVYATVTSADAGDGDVGTISAVRKSATEITISSDSSDEVSTCKWVVIRP